MKSVTVVMNGLAVAVAVAGLGLVLQRLTVGSLGAATAQDLPAMAELGIGAVAWVAYGWLSIAVLATVLEQAPGAIGQSASVVARWVTSHSSRALLRSALGIAAVTPLTIGAAHAAAPGDDAASRTVQRSWTDVEKPSVVELGSRYRWFTEVEPASSIRLARSSDRRTDQSEPRVGVPDRRADQSEPRVGVPDRPTDGAPTRYTGLHSGREIQTAKPTPGAGRRVVVRAGDSLWELAAAELAAAEPTPAKSTTAESNAAEPGAAATDAAVSARWPQWYDANRQVIGPDPDLIVPGQVLRTPDHPTVRSVPPTHQEK